MANEQCGKDRVKTNVICYEKEFSWEIVQFVDWWTSREIVTVDGMENPRILDRDSNIRQSSTWNKSTLSSVMHFEIEGTKHDFRIAILRCERWSRWDERHDVMMGVSLYYDGPLESIAIKPTFYTSNDDEHAGYPIESQMLKKGTYSIPSIFRGYSVEINRGLLNMTSFTIRCLAQVYFDSETMPSTDIDFASMPNSSTHKFYIKDFKFSEPDKNFDNLSDFEIVCVDKSDTGEESERLFRCHKIILSTNSRYYDRMFSSNYCENQGKVTVTDISSGIMETVLRYLYTRQVQKSDIDEQLYYAADKYEIDELKEVCEKELAKGISLENIVSLAVAASLCGSDSFKTNIFAFLSQQWNNIQSSDQTQLAQHYPDILTHLLGSG